MEINLSPGKRWTLTTLIFFVPPVILLVLAGIQSPEPIWGKVIFTLMMLFIAWAIFSFFFVSRHWEELHWYEDES